MSPRRSPMRSVGPRRQPALHVRVRSRASRPREPSVPERRLPARVDRASPRNELLSTSAPARAPRRLQLPAADVLRVELLGGLVVALALIPEAISFSLI